MSLLSPVTRFMLVSVIMLAAQQYSAGKTGQVIRSEGTSSAVYQIGPDVTQPELIPTEIPVPAEEHCDRGPKIELPLLVIVDANGVPHVEPKDAGLMKWATLIVRNDKFRAGMYKGQPVAVAELAFVKLESCLKKSQSSKESTGLYLKQQPEQIFTGLPEPITEVSLNQDGFIERFSTSNVRDIYPMSSGHVSQPVPLSVPNIEYRGPASGLNSRGSCWIWMIVDEMGKTKDVHLLRSTNDELSEYALKAASQFSFKPAIKDGRPVKTMVELEVTYRSLRMD